MESLARAICTPRARAAVTCDLFSGDARLRLRDVWLPVTSRAAPDQGAPDEVSRAEGRTAYLWIVPAAVEGSWRVDLQGGPSFDVTLVRRFQRVEGTIALGAVEAGLREPVLRGDTIRSGFVDPAGIGHDLTGTVSGNSMSGAYEAADRKAGWTARRR